MKLVIDEKLKHRIVGVAVIISLGAIFLPAIMKKSSHRLENNFSVNVKLPPKPSVPKVVITDEKNLFKTIKVAKIKPLSASNQKSSDRDKEDFIQSVHIVDEKTAPVHAKIEPKSAAKTLTKPLELALNDAAKHVVKRQMNAAAEKKTSIQVTQYKAKSKPVEVPVVSAKLNKSTVLNKKGLYAVQLASFSKLANAQALVNKLQKKGYKANYVKYVAKNRVVYKVYVGHSPVKQDVIKLRTQLVSAMQINGFVVNTGVS